MQKRKTIWFAVVNLFVALTMDVSSKPGAGTAAIVDSAQHITPEPGVASYYDDKYHGRKTASGEVFDTHALTAAHRTLPFGTMVRVIHQGNDRTVVVRINDRGPFVTGRIIDLSRAAARELQMERAGLAKVKLEIVTPARANTRP